MDARLRALQHAGGLRRFEVTPHNSHMYQRES